MPVKYSGVVWASFEKVIFDPSPKSYDIVLEIALFNPKDTFDTISDAAYSKLVFDLFGKDRVEAELEEFLEFDFFPRVGGGIGMTRMISAVEKMEQIKNFHLLNLQINT